MRDPLPLLINSDFPALRREKLTTLQANLGYKCNQSCLHCHVNAGPRRTESMDEQTVSMLLEYIDMKNVSLLDVTGGAPELNPHFRHLVEACTARGVKVMDRCNLTILMEPGFEDLAEFLADQQVIVVASMPCYQVDNVDAQRGDGVFDKSIAALRKLNGLGYGIEGGGLELDLVFNPQGAVLPPPQAALEADYKRELWKAFEIRFNQLFTITNMPIGRFGSILISKGTFDGYMQVLRNSYSSENVEQVMCRSLISVDWQGYVYDCDFNQMLGLRMQMDGHEQPHLRDLIASDNDRTDIVVGNHCYACTAGQGSSCGGALN